MASPLKQAADEILEALESASHQIKRALKDRQRNQADRIRDQNQAIRDTDNEMASPRHELDTGDSSTPRGNVDANGNPTQYSVYHEMTLAQRDWARSREVHFNRANADLDAALRSDPEFRDWFEGVSPGISDRVARPGGRENPDPSQFIWHHAHPDTVSGRHGVMQLVPTYQHTPGSVWWRLLHPGRNGGGGFAIWGGRRN